MYIVNLGHLTYTHFLEAEPIPVHQNRFISEAALWVHWVHRGTLSASNNCQLYSMNAAAFQTITGQFEHVGLNPVDYAKSFVTHVNANPEAISDLSWRMELLRESALRAHGLHVVLPNP